MNLKKHFKKIRIIKVFGMINTVIYIALFDKTKKKAKHIK